MSQVFDAYAAYYDLLYRDKDYAAEAEYVASHIRRYMPKARRILELGCGTGAHAEYLARMGFMIYGVDMSRAMLARAEQRKASLPSDLATRITFALDDVRTVRTGETYDVVISLFHVISYQTTNTDLRSMFETVSVHLRSSGLFLFDFWYGPAVLTQLPEARVKRLVSSSSKVLRIAEPEIFPEENRVDVNYDLFVEDRRTGAVTQMRERHSMRYLFKPELDLFMKNCGLLPQAYLAWMTEKPLNVTAWSGMVVGRRQE